jgi:hypothetical protein
MGKPLHEGLLHTLLLVSVPGFLRRVELGLMQTHQHEVVQGDQTITIHIRQFEEFPGHQNIRKSNVNLSKSMGILKPKSKIDANFDPNSRFNMV